VTAAAEADFLCGGVLPQLPHTTEGALCGPPAFLAPADADGKSPRTARMQERAGTAIYAARRCKISLHSFCASPKAF